MCVIFASATAFKTHEQVLQQF